MLGIVEKYRDSTGRQFFLRKQNIVSVKWKIVLCEDFCYGTIMKNFPVILYRNFNTYVTFVTLFSFFWLEPKDHNCPHLSTNFFIFLPVLFTSSTQIYSL